MPFQFFLAQTAAEFHQKLPPGANKAWMACHFSPYSTGLSNLPPALPPGSMVIINDRTPIAGHDPQRIAAQLLELSQQQPISHILLDLQRPRDKQAEAVAKAIVETMPCPVGISEHYAHGLHCPVFLPPPPLHIPLADYLAPWNGRPIWLELMPDSMVYTITESGCTKTSCFPSGTFHHFDHAAYCRYHIDVSDHSICFYLARTDSELALLRECKEIDCCIGLYQEFSQPEAQATAFAQ